MVYRSKEKCSKEVNSTIGLLEISLIFITLNVNVIVLILLLLLLYTTFKMLGLVCLKSLMLSIKMH